jgi:formate hydrogenlyase transcriptional activator
MNDFIKKPLQATLNLIPAHVWYANRSGALTFMNERCADYLGLAGDHPLRFGVETGGAWDSHIDLMHPDDQDQALKVWSKCVGSGGACEMDFRLRSAEGGYRWFLCRAEPHLAEDGALQGWTGINLDLEQHKHAEFLLAEGTKALRKSEEELRQIVDLTPLQVGVMGPNWERLYSNRVSLDYLGVTLEEWLRAPLGHFIHPDDRERLGAFQNRLSIGSAHDLEIRLPKGDGTHRWFLARYNPVCDDQGKLRRWYVACTDIDERKKAEERLQQENVALRAEIDETSMFEEIVGTSSPLAVVLSRVSKVAASDSTVLVTGETGTGKELVARAIHRRSRRSSRAFVAVNCAAIPRELIASELFGHEKGAFTGAMQRRLGRFELADGGTIFLDEVGEILPDTQVALLRVLQEREFERVGGRDAIHVDVRVIAATNRDLEEAVTAGTFRRDLFYRLNVFPVEMPPLRERVDDIPLLVEYFIDRYARKMGKVFRHVNKRTLDHLKSYPWPGNVRELQNVIERSVIICDSDEFMIDDSWLSASPAFDERVALPTTLAAQERTMIEQALRACHGRVFGPTGAATRLGISRSTLESKIRALRIDKRRFRPPPSKD